jgi:hypothetical protein
MDEKIKERKTLIMYADWRGLFDTLPDSDAAELIRAVFAYNVGETPAFGNATLQSLFYGMFVPLFDRDISKWVELCKKNKTNGNKGGRPKKTTQGNPMGFAETHKNPMGFDETQGNPMAASETHTNHKNNNNNKEENNSSNEESLKHGVSTGVPQVEINDAFGMVEKFWSENKPSGWKGFCGNNTKLKRLEHFKECFAVCGNNINTFNAVLKHVFVAMADAPELHQTASYNEFDNLTGNGEFFRRCYESAKAYWHAGK